MTNYDEMSIGELRDELAKLLAEKEAEATKDGRISTQLMLKIIAVEDLLRKTEDK